MDDRVHNPTKSWQTAFKAITLRALGKTKGKQIWQKYHALLTADYQALVSPRYALNDCLQLENVITSQGETVSLLKPNTNQPHYRLHFYSLKVRYLDELIPVLENMHLRVLDQVQFAFAPEGISATIKSFMVKAAKDQSLSLDQIKVHLLMAIQAVMAGRVENDALNKLCVLTGMTWQEIDVLRAYRNYYLQIGQRTTRDSFQHAFVSNPTAAHNLFNYFEARFRPEPAWADPMFREEAALFPIRMQLLENLDSVSDINDDRILRTVFNLIDATVRSNFHQRRSAYDYFIAIKINSLGVIDMPSPRPYCEIYVHAVGMEGIHLRGGKISRGGIRWSERPDDFRAEILDLMQTQINKNALIIPTGAKGGFIVKANGARQDFRESGKRAYLTLIRGLLDLTDNYHDAVIVSPEGIVPHDDPDPYLVVAADKGTAKFSDMANSVAAEYGFWLADAFASGGSHGYDHKALGITARGAWECVKRHFRELGKDIQHEPFTVVGIGSMDGDVFGNGMLLSPCIRLLAAFSGQHIFIDPNPQDLAASFKERQRLFDLPGSNWDDYDRSLISGGGGVYLRAAKDIPVSAEVKKWLDIRYKFIDGEALIRYLLAAPFELFWLGGIGTYVKASTEKREDVGDRGNDNVRIDATKLSAKVVGEGANLGFTQKARIEYSLRGGRINTDAVDNSGGVDTSDREVNLKILLTGLHKKSLIADYQSLFMDMTAAVSQLVLADNIAQSVCLSMEVMRCAENPSVFLQVADKLEAAGYLDRAVESFATNKEIQARPGQVVSRPELADLMAAAKLYVKQYLQDHASVLKNVCYDRYLLTYFPAQIQFAFRQHLSGHPLANEIKASVISNTLINQAGCGFLAWEDGDIEGNLLALIDCYLAYDQIVDAGKLRKQISNLDANLPADRHYRLLLQLEENLAGYCRWAIRNGHGIRPISDSIESNRSQFQTYKNHLKEINPETWQDQLKQYQQLGISEGLAQTMALLDSGRDFPFMVSLAMETGQDFMKLPALLNDLETTLGLTEVKQRLAAFPLRDYWERYVLNGLNADIEVAVRIFIKKLLARKLTTCADYFANLAESQPMQQYQKINREIKAANPTDLLPFVALVRAIKTLAEYSP